MTEFKVGDRVVYEATNSGVYYPECNGAQGTVTSFRNDPDIPPEAFVDWDPGSHTGTKVPTRGVLAENLRLVEAPVKIGDYVTGLSSNGSDWITGILIEGKYCGVDENLIDKDDGRGGWYVRKDTVKRVERPGTASEEEVDWKALYEVAEERFQTAQGYADDRAVENGELREQLEEARTHLAGNREKTLDHLTAEGELIEELGVMVEKLDKAEEINEVLIEEIESLHSVIVQLAKDRYLG